MEELIAFDDYNTRRQLIFNKARQAIIDKFPISNDRYTLEVADVTYGKEVDSRYTLKQQKEAILTGKSLERKLKGRFLLKDTATGALIEKGSIRSLANVPYLTRRGTFIRNGSENVVINQMRMLPGAYSRRTDKGTYETLVNSSEGQSFKLILDPNTAKFNIHVGGRKTAAYPVLKTLGVTDEEMQNAWGSDIFNKNNKDNETRALQSAYGMFIPKYKPTESSVETTQEIL